MCCIVTKEVSGSKFPASQGFSHHRSTFYRNDDLSDGPSFSNTCMLAHNIVATASRDAITLFL